jgi:DNA modification methylase
MNLIEFGDNRETMKKWAEKGIKVQMCVTSPPYYGLRDYGTGSWVGGDENCDHVERVNQQGGDLAMNRDPAPQTFQYKNICGKCGATREDKQLGQEETPEEFVNNMVDVFRHVRDILADDGVIWVNMGDSYYNYRPGKGQRQSKQTIASQKFSEVEESAKRGRVLDGYKEKDLMGIPWMLAFALRADGWYLRQDVIWNKPNPMPESVRDRCTKSHEYIFLLSKSQTYFFDNEAIKEPLSDPNRKNFQSGSRSNGINLDRQDNDLSERTKKVVYESRNRRSVWTVNTRPYIGAHFATYPPELIEPCILSSTSEKGHCPECGSRWVREVERTRLKRNELDPSDPRYRPNTYEGEYGDINGKGDAGYTATKTLGWKPTCECGHDPVPDIVFDPFMGSGTTAGVALRNGRQYMGCELNPEYGELQQNRIKDVSKSTTIEKIESEDGTAVNIVDIFDTLFSRE